MSMVRLCRLCCVSRLVLGGVGRKEGKGRVDGDCGLLLILESCFNWLGLLWFGCSVQVVICSSLLNNIIVEFVSCPSFSHLAASFYSHVSAFTLLIIVYGLYISCSLFAPHNELCSNSYLMA